MDITSTSSDYFGNKYIESLNDTSNSSSFFAKVAILFGALSSSVTLSANSLVGQIRNSIPEAVYEIVQEDCDSTGTCNYRSFNESREMFEYFEEMYKKCFDLLPFDEEISLESKNYLDKILQLEKKERYDQYDSLITFLSRKGNQDLTRAMLVFISSLDYQNITSGEEELISFGLHSSDISTQEVALNALLSIDNYSNFSALRDVFINNKYLQRDLHNFLSK